MAFDIDNVACFVLDACALIAYFNDEIGAEVVEALLDQASRNEIHLYVAAVNVYELFYDCLRRDASVAQQLLDDVYSLPLTVVEQLNPSLMRSAGEFKRSYRVSLADSMALGLAQQLDACLVSSDHHEFDSIDRDNKLKFRWIR